MITYVPYRPSLGPELLAIWQAAYAGYPIMPSLWEAITAGDPSFQKTDGFVAIKAERPVGFVFAKRFRGSFPDCERYRSIGYITLLAVHPDAQRQGIGTVLLGAAEAKFQASGATRSVIGGSFHHVMPGIPVTSPAFATASDPEALAATSAAALAFFEARGYAMDKEVWDVRRDLSQLPALPEIGPLPEGMVLRPTAEGEEHAMLEFLIREFPGRWARDMAHHVVTGQPVSQIFGLFERGRPQGFALISPPGSYGALRWEGFNRRVAALGPIGVSERMRGRGLGLALLVRALEQLRSWGATDTVIDWTDLLDFYAKVGFTPWIRYRLAEKAL